ncbi:unnamed protein product, partial [Rangifer tarandus platyrhynchus]
MFPEAPVTEAAPPQTSASDELRLECDSWKCVGAARPQTTDYNRLLHGLLCTWGLLLEALCPPGLVARGSQRAQVRLRPLRDQLADGRQTPSGPPVATAASPDRNDDLKKPPLLCPSTDAKEGALSLFGREAQRQPRLDSRVWVDGCHPYFSSASRQDPAPGRNSTPPCEGLRVFLPENV